MQKIAFVTGEYPPMEGGVGAFTEQLGRAVAALGYEVHIISSKQSRPYVTTKWRSLLEPVDLGFAQLHPIVKKWNWKAVGQVADTAVRYEFDLVNIQYQAAAYDMRSPAINFLPWRLRGVSKTAVTFHDLRTPYLFPKAGKLRQTAVYRMASHADGTIVTNQIDEDELHPRVDNPLAQIPIGSNIIAPAPDAAAIKAVRGKLGLDDDVFLLGYFGFLNETKGADTLLAAMGKLETRFPNGRFHLIFIGGQTGSSDGDNNAQFLRDLRQQIDDAGLTERVHWTGFVEDADVSTYLYAADLMVMPYRDGASLRRGTLMAALAHKRPLLTTIPQSPIPELQHNQNAYFVPADDADALTTAIQTIAADDSLRHRLAEGAGQTADLFTWDKIAEQTVNFFQSLQVSK